MDAPGKIRTCDTRIRNPVLYPLSYGGKTVISRYFSRTVAIPGVVWVRLWVCSTHENDHSKLKNGSARQEKGADRCGRRGWQPALSGPHPPSTPASENGPLPGRQRGPIA